MTLASGEVTVGLDIGTTSVKAVVADGEGTVVARARVPHKLLVPAADQLEHDANQAWRRGPKRALQQVDGGSAKAVAVTAMVPSFTAVDRKGIPRTPGLLYGDARGRAPGEERATGDGGEALEFLRWTAERYPDAHGYWPAQAVANYGLAGAAVVDGATAFSSFPLYGLEGWDEGMVTGAGASVDRMPRMEGNGVALGKVEGGAVLAAGAIDALGDQIVAGAEEPGDVLVLLGTTLITWAVITEWREVPRLWTIPHTTPERMFVGGPSNAGGLFLNWATSLLGRPTGALDPSRIPVWSPYVRGERVPIHDANRGRCPTAGRHRWRHACARVVAGLGRLHQPPSRRRRRARDRGPRRCVHRPHGRRARVGHARRPPLGPDVAPGATGSRLDRARVGPLPPLSRAGRAGLTQVPSSATPVKLAEDRPAGVVHWTALAWNASAALPLAPANSVDALLAVPCTTTSAPSPLVVKLKIVDLPLFHLRVAVPVLLPPLQLRLERR